MGLKFYCKRNTEMLPKSEGGTGNYSLNLGKGVFLRGGDGGGIKEKGVTDT